MSDTNKTEKPWTTSADMLAATQEALRQLADGKITTEEAHARARLIGGAIRLADAELEHARLTGRLPQGSDVLPRFRMGEKP